MLHRLLHEIKIELYWFKKELSRRFRMDTPIGIMGIIALISGALLLLSLIQGIAAVIRGAIPWVAGSNVSSIYWSSFGYALKISLIFIAFSVSITLFFLLKIFHRR
ncbi:hypothetical protein [Desulfitobacterium sp.]|uniref:hypothetical protein n=1 Tax=Desulfitobacterium sp. TaxID=49981 RepID=UPI002B2204FD|nr:hypothetical protein [Desulfitobacterium sp.]MEA4901294.1 hypothetical protein [Desulfitobacterium sp.]